jgi:enoyl-CoA hydratase/carnithine racemase
VYQEITFETSDPVATITLNRPEKLNATTPRMMGELRHALAQAERSRDVVGIVLTGAGRGFCAGADMAGLQEIQRSGGRLPPETAEGMAAEPGDRAMGRDFHRGLAYLLAIRKPVIAAVNGPCAGYGMSLSLFCDLRFAAESAIFTTSFAQRGLVAEHGQSWLLPRLIGPSRALDLFWSARKVGAQEALAIGLVNCVFPDGELLEGARSYVRELAARCSPRSIREMKQQVYRDLMSPLGEAMLDTERRMAESNRRPDFKEGIASFLERRPPAFDRIDVE